VSCVGVNEDALVFLPFLRLNPSFVNNQLTGLRVLLQWRHLSCR